MIKKLLTKSKNKKLNQVLTRTVVPCAKMTPHDKFPLAHF